MFRSGGRTYRFTVKIPSTGVVRIDRRLPLAMRRATSGILELTYAGSSTVRPDDVRLRAADGKALLKRTTTSLTNGRLQVGGTISSRARGLVRIRLDYVEGDGSVKSMNLRATIANGRWSLSRQLTGAAAGGGQLSIQFTGYLPARMRGEQTAKAVP